MNSDRNKLRYGSLAELQSILEERPPENMDEVRAVLMNVLDNVRVVNQSVDRLTDRMAEIAPEIQ